MTEQELRDKIVTLIKEACLQHSNICTPNGDCKHCKYDGYKHCTEYAVANALIAAGIGFDKSHLATFQELNTKLRVAEHRAEVAEKELLVYKEVVGAMLCEIDCFNEGYCPEFYKDPECENCIKKKIYGNSAATFPCLLDKYIQQAEKELREEGKDEQS